jgi:hypothetical protein
LDSHFAGTVGARAAHDYEQPNQDLQEEVLNPRPEYFNEDEQQYELARRDEYQQFAPISGWTIGDEVNSPSIPEAGAGFSPTQPLHNDFMKCACGEDRAACESPELS